MSRVEELESNGNTLLNTYAELMPEGLEELGPKQRRQVYALLRIELTMRRGGDLEIAGVLGAGTSFRKTKPTPTGAPCSCSSSSALRWRTC